MEQANKIIAAMHPSSQPQIMLSPKFSGKGFSGKGRELGAFLENMKKYRLSLQQQQR